MILQALLVSADDRTAETLIQVLAHFGVGVSRSNAADVAATRLAEERFDQVIVDFDDPEAASHMLANCRQIPRSDAEMIPPQLRLRSQSQRSGRSQRQTAALALTTHRQPSWSPVAVPVFAIDPRCAAPRNRGRPRRGWPETRPYRIRP